jgi:hypothetical protein
VFRDNRGCDKQRGEGRDKDLRSIESRLIELRNLGKRAELKRRVGGQRGGECGMYG